jgi:AcrR family transcriptional regulator
VSTAKSRPRRKDHADATRKALTHSAQKLFVSQGYNATSLDAIVAHARVTKGAMYHHFKDKRSLFEELVIAAQQQLSSAAAEAGSKADGYWNQLQAGIEHFLIGCSDIVYRRLVIEEGIAVLGLERWREIDETQHAAPLSALLQVLVDNGEIKNRSVPLMAHLILAMVTEAAICIATAEEPKKIQQEVVLLVRDVLNSFRPDKR